VEKLKDQNKKNWFIIEARIHGRKVTDLVDSLKNERVTLIDEIRRLHAEQSSLSDKLFYIEKLLVSYGVHIDLSEKPQAPAESTPSDSNDQNKASRPALLPRFNGLSLIEAIGRRIADEPERIFEI
jgi:hypothetical protein